MRPGPLAALALALAPQIAPAQSPVSVAPDVQQAQVVPSTQIVVGNTSGFALNVWISTGGQDWQKRQVPSGHATTVTSDRAVFAISTARSDTDTAADAKPQIGPAAISPVSQITPPYFYRVLPGGTRAAYCWSRGQQIWLVQVFGEQDCN